MSFPEPLEQSPLSHLPSPPTFPSVAYPHLAPLPQLSELLTAHLHSPLAPLCAHRQAGKSTVIVIILNIYIYIYYIYLYTFSFICLLEIEARSPRNCDRIALLNTRSPQAGIRLDTHFDRTSICIIFMHIYSFVYGCRDCVPGALLPKNPSDKSVIFASDL